MGIDNLLPVGNEHIEDVSLRIDKGCAEPLTHRDAVLFVNGIAIAGLEDVEQASLAEEQVGGAAYVGVAAFGFVGLMLVDILHLVGRGHLRGNGVGGVGAVHPGVRP